MDAPDVYALTVDQYSVRLGQKYDFFAVCRHHLKLKHAVIGPSGHARLEMVVKVWVVELVVAQGKGLALFQLDPYLNVGGAHFVTR